MTDEIRLRVILNCRAILENETIREIAKRTNLSKSTISIDVSKRIWEIDQDMGVLVEKVLKERFENKYIKGGETNRQRAIKKRLKNKR